MSHLDSRWRVCWSNMFPSWGAECLQGVPTSPARVQSRLSLSVPRDSSPMAPGSGWHDATQHCTLAELWTWCKSYKVRLTSKGHCCELLLQQAHSIKSAEIFVVFKRSKIKIKAFYFLEWYGILLLGSLSVVHSLEKIHAACIIPEITWLSQRLWV